MNNKVILVEDLSKLYRLGIITSKTLSQDFSRFWSKLLKNENPDFKIGELNDRTIKGNGQYVWALKEINFDVNEGEIIGIIGKNGAGKSTLLKILSRVTTPSTGSVKIKGKVASLLEVGTGFHQELTGRENIFLNGSILGMTRNEIKGKFDEIVEFSGIGRYIDTPVKRYSSGMYVRLAFGVAAHLDPEILIVDEVLAVGDAEFQKKCIGKMQDVSLKEGRTVLFVSHNMSAVKNLCSRGIILEHGRIVYKGDISSAVSKYLSSNNGDTGLSLKERTDRSGNENFRFTELNLLDSNNENLSQIISGEPLLIEMKYSSEIKLSGNLIIALSFLDGYGNIKASFITDEMGVRFLNLKENGSIYLKIPNLMLRADNYSIRLFASLNDTSAENILDSIENAVNIQILPGDYWKTGKQNRSGSYGLIDGEFYN
ncbi:MAG: ABC transporter ATP-binding protein [Ignavibacteria bacterium]|nr:ABC transporter ATP-binding protein [Ignavibacteria bacterium]